MSINQSPNSGGGGPGRSRTCNQTVMSGGILVSFVDLAAFSFDFDLVCFGSFRLFLVRNWCGESLAQIDEEPAMRPCYGDSSNAIT